MSFAASHKPRKRRKDLSSMSTAANQDLVVHNKSNAAKHAFPLVAFLWPARGTTSGWIILPLVLMTVGLFRWSLGLWGFSGFNIPPMHGDFEAQRHWMEITNHLPVSLWYFYDLLYWGLDYPPLTAYHSWLCGKIGSLIDRAWFALDESRGLEGPSIKLFMRATVIVSEYLTYIPAVVIFQRNFGRMNGVGATASAVALVAILMQPGIILIDHGHFQYNTVMLGLVVAAISCFMTNHVLWGSALFVAALGFKQMALYYAPIIFAYLLGACFTPRFRPGRLLLIATITLLSFALLFAPLVLGALYEDYREPVSYNSKLSPPPLLEDLQKLGIEIPPFSYAYTIVLQLTQAIHRIFPFARGVFEDKVANFWCLLNHAVIKLSALPTSIPLPRLSLLFTLASVFPASLSVLVIPRKSILLPALASCSWGFFLFSFQVHEKSVLLPLLPTTLLLSGSNGLHPSIRAWVGFANMLGTWSMYPLLSRDQLRTPYAVMTLLWAYLLGLPPSSLSAYLPRRDAAGQLSTDGPNILTTMTHLSFYAAMLAWHILEAFMPPPQAKPDLWVVLNVIVGALGFGLCYMWTTWKTIAGTGLPNKLFEWWNKPSSSSSSSPTPFEADNKKKPENITKGSKQHHPASNGKPPQQQQQQQQQQSPTKPQQGVGKAGKKK